MKTWSHPRQLLPALALLLALLLAAAPQSSSAQEPSPAESPAPAAIPEDAALESLGKSAARFVAAFNAKDAATIASLFLSTGEIIGRHGEEIRGREEIEEFYTTVFTADKVPQIALEASSVRLLTPDVAIEDGLVHISTDDDEPVKSVSYSVTQLRQPDGSWLIASSRDHLELTPPSEHLKPLAWLAGDWTYEGDDGVRMDLVLDLDESGNFLLGEAVATDSSGDVQDTSIRIGWNPAASSVYWWTFDSDGGNASGQWTRSGQQWIVRSTGITADAETNASTQKLSRDGDDTIVWKATDRVIAGESQPDATLRFVRRAPDPEPVAEVPAEPAGE
jgi:uncharacterized protein (TIGR02246 family)